MWAAFDRRACVAARAILASKVPRDESEASVAEPDRSDLTINVSR